MPTISEFKSQLTMGGARPNHFVISITPPIGLSLGTLDSAHRFLCKAGSLPSSTVTDIPVMYRGREVHFAGERTFAPWTVTIINELDFKYRSYFEEWMWLIQHNPDTAAIENFENYQGKVNVHQLSRNSNDFSLTDDLSMRSYVLYNAYPIDVGEIGLSYDQPNMIEEYPVTFVYDWFDFSTDIW